MNKLITALPENKIDGTIFFIPHTGLGDQIVNNGLVNLLLEKFNYVILVVKEAHLIAITSMYSYTKRIIFYTIKDDREISPRYGFNIHTFIKFINESGYYFYLQSSHKITTTHDLVSKCFSTSFYLEFGIDPLARYTNFKLFRNIESERDSYYKFTKIYGTNYIIIHQDLQRGFKLNDEIILNQIALKYYMGESDNFKLDNLFDFNMILENAKELHLMPSSVSILCDHLNITGDIFIHYYSRADEWTNQDIKELYTNTHIHILY